MFAGEDGRREGAEEDHDSGHGHDLASFFVARVCGEPGHVGEEAAEYDEDDEGLFEDDLVYAVGEAEEDGTEAEGEARAR